MPDPTYELRVGWIPQTWDSIIGSAYTWTGLSTTWTWEELSSGLVPGGDVQRVQIDQAAVTLFDPLQPGRLDTVLVNDDGTYSPDGVTYAIKPLQRMHFQAISDVGSVYKMFTGKMQQARLDPALGRRNIIFEAIDDSVELQRTVNQSLQFDINVTSLFTDIATAASWPMQRTVISSTSDVIPIAYLDNASAVDALSKVANAGAHTWFIDGGGFLTLLDRNYDFDQSLAVVASYDNALLGATYAFNQNQLYNEALVIANRRKIATSVATVAWLEDPIFLPQSESLITRFTYVDQENTESALQDTLNFNIIDPLAGATPATSVSAVSSADYQMNVSSDGLGTDLTSQMIVTISPHAQTADIVVTNGGSAGGFITKLQLNGYLITAQPPIVKIKQNAASIEEFGRRSLEIQNDLMPTDIISTAYAEWLVERYRQPLAEMTISVKNEFPNILETGLMSVLFVAESITNIASNFFVKSMSHTISTERGLEHRADYRIALADTKKWLKLDQDPAGRLDDEYLLGF